MRKLIYMFSLLFSLSSLAELNVEWIDDNTIVVTGYGYGDTTNETVLGSCTNCLAISPDEMRAIKLQIQNLIDSTLNDVYSIYLLCDSLDDGLDWLGNEITGFRRFTDIPHVQGSNTSQFQGFTNYVYSVENSQTALDRSNRPNTGASQAYVRNTWIGYNNGIYDYATQVVSPTVTSLRSTVSSVRSTTQDVDTKLNSISSVVSSITEESCQSCGGGGSTTNCTSSCPCEEQWDALLDYIRHIDDDQHKRYIQLNQISNNVFSIDKQFDSYAKLVSGILYNDATIVVDDGANSWSNVYSTGHSDLYDYNKSNILQRIELLLFGISYNTSTNWGDVTSDVESSVTDVQNNFNDANTYISDANDEYTDQVNDLSQKFRALWQAMNFFGAGSLSNFSLAEPTNTFDLYEMDYDFEKSADLSDLQRISRTCFQIFYWSIGIVFMLAFWWKVVTFTVNMSLRVVRFFNMLIT